MRASIAGPRTRVTKTHVCVGERKENRILGVYIEGFQFFRLFISDFPLSRISRVLERERGEKCKSCFGSREIYRPGDARRIGLHSIIHVVFQSRGFAFFFVHSLALSLSRLIRLLI